jgi:antitoxin CcdA
MVKQDHDFSAHIRKPTNVSLDTALVAEAKRLGINISRACETGLSQQIAQEHGRVWKQENAAALESSNTYVEHTGLPIAQHRQF